MATRRKANALEVPATIEEAHALLAEIGEHDRAIESIAADLERRLTLAKAAAAARAKPHKDAADEKFLRLKAFCDARGAKLFPKNRKSVEWPTGTVGYRWTPFRVAVAKEKADSVLRQLEALNARFVQVVKSIDKNAVLRSRKGIKEIAGLEFRRDHEFFARAIDGGAERKKKIPQQDIREGRRK